jgi:tRNA splicing ligase
MGQISQNSMRTRFSGLEGMQVHVDAIGVLWSDRIAALHVQVADKSLSNVHIPHSLNDFVHITIWVHDDDVKPFEANDLPRLVDNRLAKEFKFNEPVPLLTSPSCGRPRNQRRRRQGLSPSCGRPRNTIPLHA